MAEKTKPLCVTNPELAKQLVDPTLAQSLTAGSGKKVWWKCEHGHTWEASINSRNNGAGCPYCSNRKVLPGYNDLTTLLPYIATKLVHPEDGATITPNSRKKMLWQCENNPSHQYMATTSNVIRGSGCPYCANKKIAVGDNDLATTHPALAKQLVNPNDAMSVTSGSNKILTWRCEHGHTYTMSPCERIRKKGCPVCANRQIQRGINDLWTTHPDIAKKLVNAEDGYTVSAGSHKILTWTCEHGHVYEKSVNSVLNLNEPCPYCSNTVILKGFNDLSTTHPSIAKELVNPEDAYTVTFGSAKKVLWQCENGHTYSCAPHNRIKGRGCPICAAHNYVSNPEKELTTYLKQMLGNDDVQTSVRTLLAKQELDIVIPSKHIAIEFNGLYYHSDTFKNKHYHNAKSKACAEIGYQLLHVWEDDWLNHKDIVLKSLATKLHAITSLRNIDVHFDEKTFETTFARNLKPVMVSSKTVRDFLNQNHIQGYVNATYQFVLMDNNQTIRAVLSVQEPTKNNRTNRKHGEYEIVRFATLGHVPGGASKLMHYAEQQLPDLQTWISFSDNGYSDGGLYETLGFTVDKELASDYMYVGSQTDWCRANKQRFQKRYFRDSKTLKYDETLTERELATLNNLYRIYDAGKKRWIKQIRTP